MTTTRYELVINGRPFISGTEAQCNARASLMGGYGYASIEVRPMAPRPKRQRGEASLCECGHHYDDGTGCCPS